MSVIDPGFSTHWKTIMLSEQLGDPNAGMYVVRLWEHCHERMEDRFEMSPQQLAAQVRFPVLKSDQLEKALLECRWIERKKNQIYVRGWRERNKKMFANRENGGKGGRPHKPRTQPKPTGNPSDTYGKPTGNPSDTDGQPTGNPSDTDGQPTGNPSAAHSKPRGEERSREDSTPTVPKGTEESPNQVVETAIHHLNTLFSRPKKRMGQKSRFALEALALDGSLPLDDEHWAALRAFYAARADYPKEQMWRNSPERIAEDLLSEVTKAQTWLASKGIDFREQKKEELAEKIDPAGWREWLQDVYPTADVPAEFAGLPTSVRMEFLTRRNKERKAA